MQSNGKPAALCISALIEPNTARNRNAFQAVDNLTDNELGRDIEIYRRVVRKASTAFKDF
jgi:hypothetical protein